MCFVVFHYDATRKVSNHLYKLKRKKKSGKPSLDGMTDRRTAIKTIDQFTLTKRYVP